MLKVDYVLPKQRIKVPFFYKFYNFYKFKKFLANVNRKFLQKFKS
jgi:hypothetical protein